MPKYLIEVVQSERYHVPVEADSWQEATEKIDAIYENEGLDALEQFLFIHGDYHGTQVVTHCRGKVPETEAA